MAGWFDLPRHAAVLLVLALALPAAAQTNVRAPQGQSAPAAAPVASTDPYGRTTPRGTITGLGEAVNRNDLVCRFGAAVFPVTRSAPIDST